MKHRIKGIIVGVFVFFFFLGEINVYGKEKEEMLSLFAQSAVLMDGDSGRVLYEKNGQEFMANASTTKILTCILALESAKLEDEVTVSAYAASMPDVQMHIKEGERYRLEDLLYALMLESYNDVAVAIAEHVSGSCEKFSQLMNEKAKSIGCENTYFVTPNGLDATSKSEHQEEGKEQPFHGTTAKDLALIMRYCIGQSLAKEKFVEITATPSRSFADVEQKRLFYCQNHNSLFNLVEGVISGKTGFTGKAGYCYVGAVEKGGKQFIIALLACGWPGNKNYKWQDCKTLLEYGEREYELCFVNREIEKIKEKFWCEVINAKRKRIDENVRILIAGKQNKEEKLLKKAGERIYIEIKKKTMTAPVEIGDAVGELRYYIDKELWKKELLYSKERIEKIDFEWSINMILEKIV